MSPTLQDRFTGCLLGLAVGDALGGRFEAQSAEGIRTLRWEDPSTSIVHVESPSLLAARILHSLGVRETGRTRISRSAEFSQFAATVSTRRYGIESRSRQSCST